MEPIKKFSNLSIHTIYNIKYNRYIEYEKFLYVNKSNKITNFNLNYIKKQNPNFKIENKSFQYSDSTFSIQKTDNLALKNLIYETLQDRHNKTYNPFLTTQNKDKNIHLEFFTYNKPNISIDNNKTLKILTQKRNTNSFISSIRKDSNSSFMDGNIFESTNKNKINLTNVKSIQQNKDILQDKNLESKPRDENEFFNSINKTSILNLNLISPNERKINNLPTTYDERGYLYHSNGTYFDNDGDFFNEEGFDKNKGRHDRLGEYIPGPDFNTELGMYNKDIKNLSFDKEELKEELVDINKNEFEKIKLEGKESKKLKKKFQYPIEKDDSSDSLNITEEFEKLDQSDNFENEILPNQNLQKQVNAENNTRIETKVINGEVNNELEQNIKSEEEKQKLLKMKNEQNKEEFNKKEDEKENEIDIEDTKEEKVKGKRKGKKRSSTKDNDLTKKNERKKSKPKNKKRKKNTKINNDIKNEEANNGNDNVNNEINKPKKVKIKDIFPKVPEYTEEQLNRETDFEDIQSFINLRNLFEKYGYSDAEKDEAIDELNSIILNIKKKLKK